MGFREGALLVAGLVFIFSALAFTEVSEQGHKTKRFEICIKEIKDADKCSEVLDVRR